MSAATYSDITIQLLDELVEKVGPETEITKAEAERLFGGTRTYTVGELNRPQLLQLALYEAYALLTDITTQSRNKPNREQRRAR